MGLIKNKKGIFFTALAIVLLSLFVLSYTFYSGVQQRKTIHQRIETMQNFMDSLEEDIPRKLYVSGFRIIFLFEKEIVETGNYITDLDTKFSELIISGTLNGDPMEIMNQATISDIEQFIQEDANKKNIDITMSNSVVSISQDDPWNVKISLTSDFHMSDKAGLASWDKSDWVIDAYVPIEGFEDPLYLLGYPGGPTPNIIKEIVKSNIDSPPFDSAELNAFALDSTYIFNPLAPSFLNRLQGSSTADLKAGIESAVHIPSYGPAPSYGSVIDYLFFDNSGISSCSISGTPSWFILDSLHRSYYGIDCAGN